MRRARRTLSAELADAEAELRALLDAIKRASNENHRRNTLTKRRLKQLRKRLEESRTTPIVGRLVLAHDLLLAQPVTFPSASGETITLEAGMTISVTDQPSSSMIMSLLAGDLPASSIPTLAAMAAATGPRRRSRDIGFGDGRIGDLVLPATVEAAVEAFRDLEPTVQETKHVFGQLFEGIDLLVDGAPFVTLTQLDTDDDGVFSRGMPRSPRFVNESGVRPLADLGKTLGAVPLTRRILVPAVSTSEPFEIETALLGEDPILAVGPRGDLAGYYADESSTTLDFKPGSIVETVMVHASTREIGPIL